MEFDAASMVGEEVVGEAPVVRGAVVVPFLERSFVVVAIRMLIRSSFQVRAVVEKATRSAMALFAAEHNNHWATLFPAFFKPNSRVWVAIRQATPTPLRQRLFYKYFGSIV